MSKIEFSKAEKETIVRKLQLYFNEELKQDITEAIYEIEQPTECVP